jgi:cytochrome o ubiquinol oxidase subunit II
MRKRYGIALVGGGLVALGAGLTVLAGQGTLSVLVPKGTIAQAQTDLMVASLWLMLIVIVPVFAMTFGIAWRYRASNTKATYRPNWDHSRLAEAIWWLIPLILITILSVIIWISSHQLDPFKPIVSSAKPLRVQVVALPWKWLFIYPEQGVASLNELHLPVNRPVAFELTSDAPMNSFWIPQLGGQMYAMPGMTTRLHLMATSAGRYRGSSANLSGAGFAGMRFEAIATSQANFNAWVAAARRAPGRLDSTEYQALAKPSQNDPIVTYTLASPGLYDEVVMKYMAGGHNATTHHTGGAQ